MKCDWEVRKTLFDNVIMIGGSALFPGIQQRLSKELGAVASQQMKINVIAQDLANYSSMQVTRQEYNEVGPAIIVHKKCL